MHRDALHASSGHMHPNRSIIPCFLSARGAGWQSRTLRPRRNFICAHPVPPLHVLRSPPGQRFGVRVPLRNTLRGGLCAGIVGMVCMSPTRSLLRCCLPSSEPSDLNVCPLRCVVPSSVALLVVASCDGAYRGLVGPFWRPSRTLHSPLACWGGDVPSRLLGSDC